MEGKTRFLYTTFEGNGWGYAKSLVNTTIMLLKGIS
jgi:hypothetical protein